MGKYASKESTGTVVTWGDVTGKPVTFAPTVHDNTAHSPAYAPIASPTFTGNVTFPGTGIWNSSGNVGIGTLTPGGGVNVVRLEVIGNIGAFVSTGYSKFYMGANAATGRTALFNKNYDSPFDFNVYSSLSASGTTAPYYLYTGNRSQDLAVVILGNTKVGFGFSTPLAQVCINGGFHVGGESDPGDNNMIIDGSLMVYSS